MKFTKSHPATVTICSRGKKNTYLDMKSNRHWAITHIDFGFDM